MLNFEYSPSWKLQNLYEQPVPVFCRLYTVKVFCLCLNRISYFNLCPLSLGLSLDATQRVWVHLLYLLPPGIYTHCSSQCTSGCHGAFLLWRLIAGSRAVSCWPDLSVLQICFPACWFPACTKAEGYFEPIPLLTSCKN